MGEQILEGTEAGLTESPKFRSEVFAAGFEPRTTQSPVQCSNPLGHYFLLILWCCVYYMASVLSFLKERTNLIADNKVDELVMSGNRVDFAE